MVMLQGTLAIRAIMPANQAKVYRLYDEIGVRCDLHLTPISFIPIDLPVVARG
jgi:hypothetical protein